MHGRIVMMFAYGLPDATKQNCVEEPRKTPYFLICMYNVSLSSENPRTNTLERVCVLLPNRAVLINPRIQPQVRRRGAGGPRYYRGPPEASGLSINPPISTRPARSSRCCVVPGDEGRFPSSGWDLMGGSWYVGWPPPREATSGLLRGIA